MTDPAVHGPTPRVQWTLLVSFYGLMALAAWAWMALRGDPMLERLASPRVPAGLALASGAGLALAVVTFSDRVLERFAWTRRLRADVAAMLHPLGRTKAVVVALLSGTGEELLFRGALQPAVGLLPAALLFGLGHGGMHRELLGWALFAAVMGLLLGVLFEWTGGLLAPIAAHALINGIQLWRMAARPASD